MGKDSTIAWTDHTFNGWWGCTPQSPGCTNCYAKAIDCHFGGDHFGVGKARRMFGPKHWDQLVVWNREAKATGVVRNVFCFSMGDLMDDEAPEGELDRLYTYVNRTEFLRYLFLTKRPENYARRLPPSFPLRNVVFGASTENQAMYDQRFPVLARLRSAYTGIPIWVNIGPALGPVTIREFAEKPDWVTFEGETGANFRHMQLEWAESLLAECRELKIPFYMKQVAARTPDMGKDFIPPHLQVFEYLAPLCESVRRDPRPSSKPTFFAEIGVNE